MARSQHFRLEWKKLLNTVRVRHLMDGKASFGVTDELRTPFERDYGRTVYSSPFRRLRDKAQVFPLEPNDSVRTRLLHSQEVSSVAEDIAAQLVGEIGKRHSRDLATEDLRAIPLIAATCGLIHDIGNPAFGHAGELAISTWFAERFDEEAFRPFNGMSSQLALDFLHFEGNAQAVRTVSNLELLAHGRGLNFTAGTMSAACKYIAASNQVCSGAHEMSKPGYFHSEELIVRKVREATGTQGCRHPITYIVEAADDIVYCSVDLEDGIKKGVLHWDQVEADLLRLSNRAPIVKNAISQAKKQIQHTRLAERARHDALSQAFRIAAISFMAKAARETFTGRYSAIMNGDYHGELLMDPDCCANPLVEACKKILRSSVYRHPSVLKLEVRGRKVIHELMDLFWEGVETYGHGASPVTPKTYAGKLYLLFSDNYRRVFERRMKNKENELYCRLQLVTDQIAGMTDTYACRLHKDLTNG